jgi:hypothetical protein
MARIREPLTGRGPLRVPSGGLRSDPPGPSRRPERQPGQARQEAAGPVVVLSFSFAGWRRLQGELERVPELACTTGTGVLGMCDMAARAWANVEERSGAIAECRADSAGQLLDFESRHPESALRVRYEDLATDPAATWHAISDFTGMTPASPVRELAGDELPGGGTSGGEPAGPETRFPVALLPPQLIQRMNHLHEQLGYPRMSATSETSRD